LDTARTLDDAEYDTLCRLYKLNLGTRERRLVQRGIVALGAHIPDVESSDDQSDAPEEDFFSSSFLAAFPKNQSKNKKTQKRNELDYKGNKNLQKTLYFYLKSIEKTHH